MTWTAVTEIDWRWLTQMKTAVDDQREPGVIDRNTTQNITKKIKINQQLKNQT